ncbi:MAG: N-acetylglucosamine-6-phosphate deacetylase [Clostridia bacterium]|nr:N-acetylglucosamine-6-phosphate deacetylase [Clostridia bacterium]
MNLWIKNANAYIDHRFVKTDVYVLNGKIADFRRDCCAFEDVPVLDLKGAYLVPGFIDIHTHGAAGIDVNAADGEGFAKMAAFFASKGTTAFLASVLTDSPEHTTQILEQIALFKSTQPGGGASLLGAHLEGPFLAAAKKGAMPEAYLKSGDTKLLGRYLESGVVKYITIAPEIEGAQPLIAYAAQHIPVALGHSAADYATAQKAISAGAKAATHCFNAMRGLDRTEPAILGAVLENEDIANELIADGKHVHPANIRLLYRLKGNKKVMLITDSIQAAGMPDGQYRLGMNDVTLSGGEVFLSDTNTRAGSVLTMDRALRNILDFLDISLEEALPMLCENQAELFGLNKGYIRLGYDADFTVLGNDLTPLKTIVGGNVVFEQK